MVHADSAVENVADLLQPGGWHDDCIPPTPDIFRNLQEPPSRVLSEIEGKQFTLDLYLFAQQFGIHSLPPPDTSLSNLGAVVQAPPPTFAYRRRLYQNRNPCQPPKPAHDCGLLPELLLGSAGMERTSFTYKLTTEQQAALLDLLRLGNYRTYPLEHTRIAVEADRCRVALYKSGKCLIQGKGAADFVTFTLEPFILQSAALGYEDVLNPEAIQPHMGVDESGKGDFFGPLVVAAAYVDPDLADTMREMDVKDSKAISSDAKAMRLGRDLRRLLDKRWAMVKIGPAAYNRLYAKMRNVNTLLAWAHARAIENLLEAVPDCPLAISDQFGSKEQVKRALMKKGREITLEQRHRAESDMAVAAASIIAREMFLRSLKDMEKEYGVDIPKGASAAVRESGVGLVKQRGPEILLAVSKTHFKTADAVLEAAGKSRADLGPDGQATSRPMDGKRPWSKGKKLA